VNAPSAPEPPLTTRRKALLAAGALMLVAQVLAAWVISPALTGPGDASAGALAATWCGSVAWSAATALLLVRLADLPDVATASMIAVISAFAAFTLSGALDLRGTDDAVNVTDALFLGVTAGGLTSVVVWLIAFAVARLLRLPATPRKPR
jgi:hypothetical protein